MTEARFLLDSNICIYLLEGLSEAARRRAEDCAPGEIVTSSIAYAEVISGIAPTTGDGIGAVETFFRIVDVRLFDRAAAVAYRSIPFRRARFDRLIAAHAVSLGLTLITNNTRDFTDIPQLRVENWTR